MSILYVLDVDRNPISCDDLTIWFEWFAAEDNRRVAFDEVAPGVRVSTVFLGLNHNFDAGPPILFETMVFDDYESGDQFRYHTWYEAEAGHREVIARIMARICNVAELPD